MAYIHFSLASKCQKKKNQDISCEMVYKDRRLYSLLWPRSLTNKNKRSMKGHCMKERLKELPTRKESKPRKQKGERWCKAERAEKEAIFPSRDCDDGVFDSRNFPLRPFLPFSFEQKKICHEYRY